MLRFVCVSVLVVMSLEGLVLIMLILSFFCILLIFFFRGFILYFRNIDDVCFENIIIDVMWMVI